MTRIDLGAWVAVALARPLGAFIDSSREGVARYVRGPHATVHEVGLGAAVRAGAWIFAGAIFLGLAVLAAAVEDIANVSGVASGLLGPPMVACFLTGVFSAIRAGIAWFVSEDRWVRAGRILRWVVTPGNRDVILAVLLVVAGLLIANA